MRWSRFLPLALIVSLTGACDDAVSPPTAMPLPPSLSALASTASANGLRYSLRVLDLDAHLGADEQIGAGGALNNRGQVAGQLFRDTELGPRVAGAIIWDSETGTVEVAEIDGLSGMPFINDAGQLAGTLRRPPPALPTEPFLWTPGVGVQQLGFTGVAEGIGPNGEVVGIAHTESVPQGEAFRWDPGSGTIALGTLPGESSSRATAINGAAVVAGHSGSRAVVWHDASPAALLAPEGIASRALAINGPGQIVGVHFVQPGVSTGILWPDPDAEPVLLPCDPPGFQECRAIAINDQGIILGSYGADEAELPMVWAGGVAYELTALIEGAAPMFLFALGLNDRGQIGGYGLHSGSDSQLTNTLVLLTPVSDARTVRIDVKPNSDPNSFNLDGNGTVPVAILGEADLGPDEIDPGTLELNGLVIAHRGNGEPQCEAEDVDGDGFADLVCHFQEDLSLWTGPHDVATLTGALFDGTAIQGSDAIRLTQ